MNAEKRFLLLLALPSVAGLTSTGLVCLACRRRASSRGVLAEFLPPRKELAWCRGIEMPSDTLDHLLQTRRHGLTHLGENGKQPLVCAFASQEVPEVLTDE